MEGEFFKIDYKGIEELSQQLCDKLYEAEMCVHLAEGETFNFDGDIVNREELAEKISGQHRAVFEIQKFYSL